MNNTTHLFIIVSVITLIALVYALRDEERFAVLKTDFSNHVFLFFFVIIVLFSIWGLNSSDKKINQAVEKALIAFTTAYLSHLNMSFAVFFIIVVFAYYLHK